MSCSSDDSKVVNGTNELLVAAMSIVVNGEEKLWVRLAVSDFVAS